MSSEASSATETAIRIEGVGKCYPVYDRPFDRLRQFIAPRVARALGRTPQSHYREYWALRDISCEIRRGEQVGIVGRNGAGKSTLLQVVCGTLAPTTGQVSVNGRVAALLELGAGFNPEFTGRENVVLNAGILGLTAREIDERMDAILAFADIGAFVEQPVRTYSSGMHMRLAFAVAIHVMPDILVVDEALSVGDEAFGRKCFARIRAIREQGGTILFVSHSAGTVAEVCDRAILLDRGELLAIGDTREVLARYQKLLYAPAEKAEDVRAWIAGSRPGADPDTLPSPAAAAEDDAYDEGMARGQGVTYPQRGVRIGQPWVETPQGRRVNVLRAGRDYLYRYPVHFDDSVPAVRFGMMIKTVSGVELGGAASVAPGEGLPLVTAGSQADLRFAFRCMLAPGTYFLNAGVVGLVGEEETYLAREVDALMIRVQDGPRRTATGLVDFAIQPRIEFHD